MVNGANVRLLHVTNMKVVIKMTRRMVWEHSFGNQETNIVVVTKMMNVTAMVKCSGKMVAVTRAAGRMVFNMA